MVFTIDMKTRTRNETSHLFLGVFNSKPQFLILIDESLYDRVELSTQSSPFPR